MEGPHIIAVARDARHRFSKQAERAITLVAGLGVEGDAHCGRLVQHRSRVAADPTQPNLRQVHLVGDELLDELRGKGFALHPGAMGENVLTHGLALLDLSAGTRLRLGAQAVVEVTGLRNPCAQLDSYQPGLMHAVLGRAADGALIRKAGVMAIVVQSGLVSPGDAISVATTPTSFVKLEAV